jgi:hypothetical protein
MAQVDEILGLDAQLARQNINSYLVSLHPMLLL